MGIEMLTQNGGANIYRVQKMTNSTTDSSSAASTGNIYFVDGACFRLRNDGSTLYFEYSMDGWNFVTLFSESVGTFITPDKIGWGALCQQGGTNNVYASVISWQTVGNATA